MFVPAGQIIPANEHRVRTVELRQSPRLPDGEYSFVDTHCTDPECDCRRTLIQVFLDGKHVSTIGFGWETPKFYKKWMGGKAQDQTQAQMHGATIDPSSPNLVSPQGMLAFFQALRTEMWITGFKRHYAAVKAKLAGRGIEPRPSAPRRGPSPGSSRKGVGEC